MEGAVGVGAGTTSIDDAVDCAAEVDEAEREKVDFLELGGYVAKGRSQPRMLQLDQILRKSNGLNLRIWLNSSRICLLKHQVPQISFSIITVGTRDSKCGREIRFQNGGRLFPPWG